MIIRADGVITWELPNGRLHRPDGPALYDKDMRCEEWYLNGSLHRVDGPAKIRRYINNYEEWYLNGITHRSDGPAVTFSDGQVVYCIHGNLKSSLESISSLTCASTQVIQRALQSSISLQRDNSDDDDDGR